jgi:hypothetical protein
MNLGYYIPHKGYMKILFLDFDGVLNSSEWFSSKSEDFFVQEINHFNPEAVEMINEIVRATNCRVVVSSAWRIGHTLDHLNSLLHRAGFEFFLLGMTPIGNRLRGDEIQDWISEFSRVVTPVTSFCILDDSSDMGGLMHKLVQTTFALGLQASHVSRVIEMLNS